MDRKRTSQRGCSHIELDGRNTSVIGRKGQTSQARRLVAWLAVGRLASRRAGLLAEAGKPDAVKNRATSIAIP